MNQEITTEQRCVMIRGGIEIWINATQAETLEKAMETQKYVKLHGSTIATFDIQGIYTPEHVGEHKRYLNGQFKCMKGNWHDKGQRCDCRTVKTVKKGVIIRDGKEIEVEVKDY